MRATTLLLVVTVGLTAGCATGFTVRNATRYTWMCAGGPCAPAQLTQDHAACAEEATSSSGYVPRIAANGVQKSLYKTCMEKRGYTKVRSMDGIRYQSPNDGKFSLKPGIDTPGPGEVDLMLWL